MPAALAIDVPRRLVLTRYEEVLTLADAMAWAAALTAHPHFSPEFRHLADFRGVVRVALTSEEVKASARLSPFDRTARRAFVAADDVTYGVGRMFQSFRDESAGTHGLFRTVEEATAWLGFTDDAAAVIAALAAAPRVT